MGDSIQRHKFQHNARSIIQMGEELIGHPSTALNELVKNSYDADAQSCYVYFHFANELKESFALIFDDGSGMDANTLFGDWLHCSASSKRQLGAISPIYKRHFLGSKGIGRLAALAIGRYTTVITKTATDTAYQWLTLDRERFHEERLLSEIEFPGDTVSEIGKLFFDATILTNRNTSQNKTLAEVLQRNKLDHFNNGTLIVIEGIDESVKEIINKDHLTQNENSDARLENTTFYKALATLVTPLGLSSKIQKELVQKQIISKEVDFAADNSTFQVYFGINLLPDQDSIEIEWQRIEAISILSVYDYRVIGRVTNNGSVEGVLSFNRIDGDSYEEEFIILRKDIDYTTHTNEAGEYAFDIRIYDIGEIDNLEKLAKLANCGSGSAFKQIFKRVQGLRVAKNGFGVKPYGEEGVDWIELSKLRVNDPGHNVNTNQILGYVFFYSPKNDKLQEKTNREGFLENTAFIGVKETLQTIFKNLGRRRFNYRLKHGLGRSPKSRHQRPDIQKFIERIKSSNDLPAIRKSSENFVKEITTSLDNLEESLTFSERLASLGTGIELVYHEMAQPISRLHTTRDSLSLKENNISPELKEKFHKDLEAFNDSTTALSELRKSLQPAIGRSRKKHFKPYNTFLKVCSLYRTDFEDSSISLKSDDAIQTFEVTTHEYAFWISFLNIINNAVYWIKRSEKPGGVRISLENDCIVISNSGPQIPPELIEYIFEYGVTAKTERHATGLGLSFTRSILSTIDWNITAVNRVDGPAFIMNEVNNV